MSRNFEKYAELGREKIQDDWHYQLSMDECDKAMQIFEKAKTKHGNTMDPVLEVAMYFYHAGIETGRRYEKNKHK